MGVADRATPIYVCWVQKPPSDEGGGFCEAKDGGREYIKETTPQSKLRFDSSPDKGSMLQFVFVVKLPDVFPGCFVHPAFEYITEIALGRKTAGKGDFR